MLRNLLIDICKPQWQAHSSSLLIFLTTVAKSSPSIPTMATSRKLIVAESEILSKVLIIWDGVLPLSLDSQDLQYIVTYIQATRRLTLPIISFRGISFPVAGLFSGFLAAGAGFDLFTFYKWSRKASVQRDAVLGGKNVPLWSNLRNAVNPDRAFFELADERNNDPLVFHSGLYTLIKEGPQKPQPGLFLTRLSEKHLTSPMLPVLMGTTDEKQHII